MQGKEVAWNLAGLIGMFNRFDLHDPNYAALFDETVGEMLSMLDVPIDDKGTLLADSDALAGPVDKMVAHLVSLNGSPRLAMAFYDRVAGTHPVLAERIASGLAHHTRVAVDQLLHPAGATEGFAETEGFMEPRAVDAGQTVGLIEALGDPSFAASIPPGPARDALRELYEQLMTTPEVAQRLGVAAGEAGTRLPQYYANPYQ